MSATKQAEAAQSTREHGSNGSVLHGNRLALDRLAGRFARTNGRWGLVLGRLLDSRIDIVRTGDDVRITVAVPDVAEESIKVTIDDDDVLRIRGLYRSSPGATRAVSFSRAVSLQMHTDEAERHALLADGLLTVRLGRRARRAPMALPVSRR